MLYLFSSPKKTQAFALKAVTNFIDTNLVCLYGDLGSGKTTFVQGLAKKLGVKEEVRSPSFNLIREYKINSKKLSSFKYLVHIDCYRLNSNKDFKSVDVKEYWQNKRNLVVIEWAEKVKSILPKQRLDLEFFHVDQNKRMIKVL